jgi:hypothetical protein
MAIRIAIAFLGARLMTVILFGVSPLDPGAFISGTGILSGRGFGGEPDSGSASPRNRPDGDPEGGVKRSVLTASATTCLEALS